MRLENSLYSIKSAAVEESRALFHIALNGEHFIYKAHFPGSPITPGVCLCQIVCELAEKIKVRELKLHQVKNIKFLTPVSPREVTELDAELECRDSGEFTTLKATLSANGERYTKLSIILK